MLMYVYNGRLGHVYNILIQDKNIKCGKYFNFINIIRSIEITQDTQHT